MTRRGSRSNGGFALVLTVALLALMVLALYALSALVRVDGQISVTTTYQVQARQNALLALSIAQGELQRFAGPDDCVTAMAGMTGVPPQSSFRHWCGVWRPGVLSPDVWLVSGAASPTGEPAVIGERIVMVGANTVGTPADRTEQELVEVGAVAVPAAEGGSGGHLAYWVGDEGAKASAIIMDSELQFAGTTGTGLRPNFRRLVASGFNPAAPAIAKVISFEQLKQVSSGVSLTGSFHALTRSSGALPSSAPNGVARPADYVVGAFNINTTATAAWRAFLEYPDHNNAAFGLAGDRPLQGARRIRDLFAQRRRPFTSIAELEATGLIQEAFDTASPKITAITQAEFLDELRPILTVRSDTFRIRAYGDAANPIDGRTEAVAYCEAMVQRTPEIIDATLGRRFVITYFRWLGPDDI